MNLHRTSHICRYGSNESGGADGRRRPTWWAVPGDPAHLDAVNDRRALPALPDDGVVLVPKTG